MAEAARRIALDEPGGDDTICYRLPQISIDVARLIADFDRVREARWVPQDRYARGVTNWTGIALYSVNGDVDDLRCASRPTVRRTAAGHATAYICEQLLPLFRAPVLRVAFYRLHAHTSIGEHHDYGENRTMGFVRIHMPVVTNDRVVMYLDDKAYRFNVGEAWYFDASARHRVENGGDDDRVHLIADFKMCPALGALLKPLTWDDRLRFARHRLEYYREVVRMSRQFMGTAEGRRRIATKVVQVVRDAVGP